MRIAQSRWRYWRLHDHPIHITKEELQGRLRIVNQLEYQLKILTHTSKSWSSISPRSFSDANANHTHKLTCQCVRAQAVQSLSRVWALRKRQKLLELYTYRSECLLGGSRSCGSNVTLPSVRGLAGIAGRLCRANDCASSMSLYIIFLMQHLMNKSVQNS